LYYISSSNFVYQINLLIGLTKSWHHMEPLFFIIITLLIGVATRHLLRKMPFPYTALLLIFGLIVGILYKLGFFRELETLENALFWAGNISPNVILFIFLPILIFKAANGMDIYAFKKTAANAIILAVPGIIIALFLSGAFAMGLNYLNIGFGSWSWSLVLMFGAAVCATDPVTVVAIMKELGASKKLRTLIDSESILNNGTAIVVFMVFFTAITGSAHNEAGSLIGNFLSVSLGGTMIGLIIAGVTIIWVKRVFNDTLIEISLIIVTAYLTFYLCEHFFHVSGVIGLITLGLTMASIGKTRISADVGVFLQKFWELAAFFTNVLIFFIAGMVIAQRSILTWNDILTLFLIYIGIHIARGLMVLLFYPFMRKPGYGINKKEGWILWFSGLRGAVSLALALVIAGEQSINPEIRNQFLFYMAGTVILTLLINATTLKALVNLLGLADIGLFKTIMFTNAFKSIDKDLNSEVEILEEDRFMKKADWTSVKTYLPYRTVRTLNDKELESLDPASETRRRALEKEKSSYWSQFEEGILSPLAYARLTNNINELIHKEGKVPLSDRAYLKELWNPSPILSKLSFLPFVNRLSNRTLMENLATSYDILRGFYIAQDEVLNMLSSMDFDFNLDNIIDESESLIEQTILEEVNNNRLMALELINKLNETYPEIIVAIETKQAARSLLNHERININRLYKESKIEDDEAERMIIDVEKRMKVLVRSRPAIHVLKPLEILAKATWLRQVDPETIEKVKSIAVEKIHSPGEILLEQGESAESGMVIITRGAVRILVGEKAIDLLGSGQIIGEMSVLSGNSRTATVLADSTVTALWLSTAQMQKIITQSDELEHNLWNMAGMRYAENILENYEPFCNWPKIKFRRWLNKGEIVKLNPWCSLSLINCIAVLVSGVVKDCITNHQFNAPAVLNNNQFIILETSWVYQSPDLLDTDIAEM
jgi:NhaP-type Na+/H+ or K+/H+ antiporter